MSGVCPLTSSTPSQWFYATRLDTSLPPPLLATPLDGGDRSHHLAKQSKTQILTRHHKVLTYFFTTKSVFWLILNRSAFLPIFRGTEECRLERGSPPLFSRPMSHNAVHPQELVCEDQRPTPVPDVLWAIPVAYSSSVRTMVTVTLRSALIHL